MRKFFYFLLLAATVSTLFAEDRDKLLSSLKRDIIDTEKKQNKNTSDILKWDWIEPLKGSYIHNKSKYQFDNDTKKTDNVAISMSQPVFKSGGIYYAIQYSNANREFLKLSTLIEEKNLLKSAISSLISIRKLDLQIKKQEYLIENSKIDILRKKEQYLSGFLDSSYLDNAILAKNQNELSFLELKSSKEDLVKAFKNISDADYNDLEPPHFKMIDMNTFIEENIEVRSSLAAVEQTKYLKNMTISTYLPTFSVTASYNKNRTNYLGIDNEDFHQYGLTVSMPLLDVNMLKEVELKKLDLLKSKLESDDKKREERILYKNIQNKIGIYKKKIEMAKENKSLYASLLDSTRELYEAGEKTEYDVDTMENSFKIMGIEIDIHRCDIQLQMLELYAKMNGKFER